MIILLRGCDFRPRFFLLPALNGVHEIAYRVIRLSYIITGFKPVISFGSTTVDVSG